MTPARQRGAEAFRHFGWLPSVVEWQAYTAIYARYAQAYNCTSPFGIRCVCLPAAYEFEEKERDLLEASVACAFTEYTYVLRERMRLCSLGDKFRPFYRC